ncbi:hypothetical protein JTB14_037542 [Gonioctena quinquepunctata]|nr:hypothetical protein JTB14_037542 [Gonioctena quinquepunctata]
MNYETSLLTIPVHNSVIVVPPHEIVVPPRSEFITKIRTHFSQPNICFNKDIKPGLFSSNCIVDPKKGICTISLINSSEISQSFHSSDLEFDDLENYHVIDFINISDKSRISLLESQIDTTHRNTKEQQSILDICQNYNELFHSEGDQLTCTDAITYSIPPTSKTPVFVKPYRLPEHQKGEIKKQIQNLLDQDIIQKQTKMVPTMAK